jgi:hypothetical protein
LTEILFARQSDVITLQAQVAALQSPTSITITPPANTSTQALIINQTGPSSVAGPLSYNSWTITTLTNATGSGAKDQYHLPNTQTSGLFFTVYTGGNNLNGPVDGIVSNMRITTSSTANSDKSAVQANSYANVPFVGVLNAVNAGVNLDSGATTTGIVEGLEAAINLGTGSSAAYRVGVMSENAGATQASTLDAAYGVTSYAAGGAFQNLIALTQATWGGLSFAPLSTTANFITADAAYTFANFLYLPTATFTGSIINTPNVIIGGPGTLQLVGPTLGNGQAVLNIAATQPASPVATQNAIVLNITSNGSASIANTAIAASYQAGYIGNHTTRGIIISNLAAGTANNPLSFSTTQGNLGFVAQAAATTTGANIGGMGSATGGNVNIGLEGQAVTAKNSATNIGVVGYGLNTGTTPVEIGVLATMNGTLPTVSAALIADNGTETIPVALFQVGGATKFSVDTYGNPTLKVYLVSTLPSAGGAGALALVSDATSNTVLGAGGGSAYCLAAWNGSSWVAV